MRFFILAGVFTAVVVLMILALDSGRYTRHTGVSAKEEKILSKLPRP